MEEPETRDRSGTMAFFSTLASGWQQNAAGLASLPSKTVSFGEEDEAKRNGTGGGGGGGGGGEGTAPPSPPALPPLPAHLRTGKVNLREMAAPEKNESGGKAKDTRKASLTSSGEGPILGRARQVPREDSQEEFDEPPELEKKDKETEKKKKKGSFREKRELRKGSSARDVRQELTSKNTASGSEDHADELNDLSTEAGKKRTFKSLFDFKRKGRPSDPSSTMPASLPSSPQSTLSDMLSHSPSHSALPTAPSLTSEEQASARKGLSSSSPNPFPSISNSTPPASPMNSSSPSGSPQPSPRSSLSAIRRKSSLVRQPNNDTIIPAVETYGNLSAVLAQTSPSLGPSSTPSPSSSEGTADQTSTGSRVRIAKSSDTSNEVSSASSSPSTPRLGSAGKKMSRRELRNLNLSSSNLSSEAIVAEGSLPRDRKGKTEIHYEVEKVSTGKLVELLEKYPTEIDAKDKSGWTALHVAASEGKLSSVETLLNFGADVNAKTVDGATPLHYFVRCNYGADRKKYFSLLRKFLASGADPNCQNSSGETALHAIALKNKVEEFQLLLTETKADVNLKNKWGETCLHVSARMGHRHMVLLLLAYGVDASIEGANGTAKHVALSAKQLGIYQILGGDKVEAAVTCSRFTSAQDLQRIVRCQRIVRKFLAPDIATTLRRLTRKLNLVHETYLADARKRYRKLMEFYQSQGRYIDHLENLSKHFLQPFRECSWMNGEDLEPRHVHAIFSNIEDVLEFTRRMQKALADKMEDRSNVYSAIGGYFLSMIPSLPVYSDYVTNYENSMNTLQQLRKKPTIAALIQRCEESSGQRNNLGSYLIMPIQQLPKYNLFLQDVRKLTPKDHIDYEDTVRACDQLEVVINAINKLTSAIHDQKGSRE